MLWFFSHILSAFLTLQNKPKDEHFSIYCLNLTLWLRLETNQKIIAEHGAIPLLINLLKEQHVDSVDLLKNVAGALGNLALSGNNT
jgi:hypothetical protein